MKYGGNPPFFIILCQPDESMRYQNDGACHQPDIAPRQKHYDTQPDQESAVPESPEGVGGLLFARPGRRTRKSILTGS